MAKYKAQLVICGQKVRTSANADLVVDSSHYGIFNGQGYYIKPAGGPKWVAMQVAKEMTGKNEQDKAESR